ncbi:MAG: hypothetical protein A3H94_04680 [Acidobacteria bacterium RIFCSPLOWO2_02_FULL_60_20]|nr:MAG: hypothetical protein A3H94_04680 [Acidobacteria bacterium RIFCSPLOWO2_02_FULL_60_20]
MRISYNAEADLLYLRFDEESQELINKRVSDDVVLDLGTGDRIVGIEILDASQHLDLAHLLPVTYEATGKR